MGLSNIALLLAVAGGAFAQGATGIGFALVAAPACALALDSAQVMGTVARLAITVDVVLAIRDLRQIDFRVIGNYLWSAPLALPLAIVVSAVLPAPVLITGTALGTLFFVALVMRPRPSSTRPSSAGTATTRQVVAGFASGFMGVTTGLSGPPVALEVIRTRRPVVRSRATLALFFAVIDITAAFAHPRAVALGTLLPMVGALIVGLGAGRRLADIVNERLLRLGLAAIVAITALGAIARQLS